MPSRDLTFAMVGSGGDGVVTMGEMLAQAAARDGLNVIKTEAYGPQIRGGETSCVVRVAAQRIYAQGDAVDILAVFNWADFARFKGEIALRSDAVVLFEEADAGGPAPADLGLGDGHQWIAVPFAKLATESAGTKAAKNIVSLGLFAELFGLPAASIRAAVEKRFGKKKAAVLEANLKGFDAGAAHARTLPPEVGARRLTYETGPARLLMSGNEAAAVGALHAGCRFFGGYPITPASEVMEILAAELPKVGGAMVQLEDEIASIGAVLGAAFAGVPSMTATSGPGMSLMAELIGLGSMAEIPCVIVNVQRGGPSTGLPTKTEQADLTLALAASHGDTPHVVVAPTTIRDCFEIMPYSFEIAEKYQLPVLVLSEQALGFRRADLPKELLTDRNVRKTVQPAARLEEDGRYLRYKLTPDGVSPRAIPGMPGLAHVVTGLEHAEDTKPAYDPPTRRAQMEKRQRKLDGILREYKSVLRYGDPKPEIGVIGWGSTAGPIREAVDLACKQGIKAGGLVPRMIYPSPNDDLRDFVKSCKKVIVVEGNMTGQYAAFLRSQLPGFDPLQYNRYDGLPVRRLEVLQKIQEVAR